MTRALPIYVKKDADLCFDYIPSDVTVSIKMVKARGDKQSAFERRYDLLNGEIRKNLNGASTAEYSAKERTVLEDPASQAVAALAPQFYEEIAPVDEKLSFEDGIAIVACIRYIKELRADLEKLHARFARGQKKRWHRRCLKDRRFDGAMFDDVATAADTSFLYHHDVETKILNYIGNHIHLLKTYVDDMERLYAVARARGGWKPFIRRVRRFCKYHRTATVQGQECREVFEIPYVCGRNELYNFIGVVRGKGTFFLPNRIIYCETEDGHRSIILERDATSRRLTSGAVRNLLYLSELVSGLDEREFCDPW